MRRAWWAAVVLAGALGCSAPEPPPEETAELEPLVAAEVYPVSEDGVLQAFTAAVSREDIVELERVLTPELGAHLGAVHDRDPDEFWRRGAVWVENAGTGMEIALRADDADTAERWRALVRFGNDVEETIEFAWVDGELRLAQL